MLLPDNIHPENSIFFNGSIVLQVLLTKGATELLELYSQSIKMHNMSFPIFILCLDWLYLIGAAELINNEVVLCS